MSMDKYEILEKKLINIIEYIDTMTIEDRETCEYLLFYKSDIEELIESIDARTIRDSRGASLGLFKGISDYEEICADDQLCEMLADADKYYSEDCYRF